MRFGPYRGAALLALAAATFLAAPQALRADPVLYVDDANGVLGKVDVATGGVTIIGSTAQALTDIAFDPTGGLWGLTSTDLYRINATTGAATLVGAHGINGGNALVFGADGTLYAAGSNTTNLYQLNTATGAGTDLGNIGYTSSGDLAFNGGRLYLTASSFASDYLVSINLAAGTLGIIVGPIGYQQVFGLATASSGTLYGVSGTQVISIDTTTGAGTFVSNYAGHGLQAAFGTGFVTEAGAPPVVPLPGAAAMGLALLGLTAAGGAARRHRANRPALLAA
jgi:streptogramin lyase